MSSSIALFSLGRLYDRRRPGVGGCRLHWSLPAQTRQDALGKFAEFGERKWISKSFQIGNQIDDQIEDQNRTLSIR